MYQYWYSNKDAIYTKGLLVDCQKHLVVDNKKLTTTECLVCGGLY